MFWIDLLKNIEFITGEFSNCIWGIYLKKRNLNFKE
tara:strand:+ start:637 stop:744 length:108 start_codon:yes stop_codon:yes gene_type:complete